MMDDEATKNAQKRFLAVPNSWYDTVWLNTPDSMQSQQKEKFMYAMKIELALTFMLCDLRHKEDIVNPDYFEKVLKACCDTQKTKPENMFFNISTEQPKTAAFMPSYVWKHCRYPKGVQMNDKLNALTAYASALAFVVPHYIDLFGTVGNPKQFSKEEERQMQRMKMAYLVMYGMAEQDKVSPADEAAYGLLDDGFVRLCDTFFES